MPTLEELVQIQDKNADEINRVISNIRKTPRERRTIEYYQSKSRELNELWLNFERTDNKIRDDKTIKEDHPYFSQDLHSIMRKRYREADDDIQKNIQLIIKSQTNVHPNGSAGASSTEREPPVAARAHNLVQLQNVTIGSVMGTLDEVLNSSTQHTRQYLDAKLKLVEYNLDTIQQLQNKICIENIEHDIEEFLTNQAIMAEKIMQIQQLKTNLETASNLQEQSMQHLPKVTIPKFNGDYLTWQPFYDMFNEMIHKKTMPAIQKMWFLKTNVTGEAARLIQNLPLTEANYETAWKTLKDRYNNPRILTTSILDKLVAQQKLPENPSALAVKGLHDTSREAIYALNNLNINTESWDPILVHILVKKLDQGTHVLYEQSIQNPRDLPSLKEFLSFLETRFQSLEAIGQNTKSSRKTVTSVTTLDRKNHNQCKLCKNGIHSLYHCNKFLGLSVSDRLKWVQQQHLCVNCFKNGHMAKQCMTSCCRNCNKKHNTLVHLGEHPIKSAANGDSSAPTLAPSTVAYMHHTGGRQGYVLLATARVKITANNGQSGVFRAILDSGSQINIVSTRLVRRLSINPSEASLYIEGVGKQSRKADQRINVELHSTTSNFSTRLEAFVLPSIIPAQPSKEFDIKSWPIPENIQLADPNFNNTGNIDVLLGAEYYFKLMATGKIQLSEELPILQNTRLGWILSGKIKEDGNSPAVCAIFSEDEARTSELVQRFWKLDDHESNSILTTEERKCEKHFAETTTRDSDGRFIVRLPFSEHPSCLADTKGTALLRFTALERRLSKNPYISSQYVELMEQYEALGHMTRIEDREVHKPYYYIPHHCVLKPESSTTKLRVVFDASAKSTSGRSLNDILYTGPPTQGDLFGMQLRFRMPRFVFCTDIEKMYRQILVDPADRNMQLILWRKNPTDAIQTYKLNTVTYGTSAAPYLATKCLQRLAETNMERYPLGSSALKYNFYVDDGMTGSDSLLTAVDIQQQLTKLLQEAGFKLRKWCANHSKLLSGIPPEDLEVNLDFENKSTKVLGLTWNPKADLFLLKVEVQDNQMITKRAVTSDVARIFDPLGISGPVVVMAKIFIQQLWQLQISWDDPLPANLNLYWTTFRQNLKCLNNLNTKRHIFDGQVPRHTQLHTFVDASEKAYGAAVYLRSRLQDGRLIVRLLCAKSRIAPLKRLTLPRLELCAALLGAELTQRVRKELRVEGLQIYLWSDSEIVLHWINSKSSSLRTFVANRVSKIQEITINIGGDWRHVSSKNNPADHISRGLNPERLLQCNLWFYGPIFLHGNEDQWPKEFNREQAPSDITEFKSNVVTAISSNQSALEDLIYNINHRNSFRLLQRIVAYMQRFIQNMKKSNEDRPTTKALSPQELTEAMHLIIRTVQTSDFKHEITSLKKNQELDKSNKLCSLSPFLDETNILRVGGRLQASSLSYSAKHPILLPYNDSISRLILTMLHNDNHHCGPQTLLAISRQQFWIIKGKSMARNIVQNCVRCSRCKPRLLKQLMGELPASRITPARPFSTSGVDYCGPFWVHYKVRGKRPHKVYIAVFVCFSTKAVHLEVVSDLTTDAFIGALKRFIARRGRCQTIYSDNATNFVGARNQLQELSETIFAKASQETITRCCSRHGIEFKFIPPRAPHFGGLWEAAVKAAKQLLLRSVATASLTYEELETVIIEIEAILNSRPLTPLSTDPNDLTALTPGHFLIGEPLTAQVDSRVPIQTNSLAARWKLVSQLKHEFWNRWSKEYLHQLQEKQKWKTTSENVKEGQMVIIKEDNLPVMQWPLGRILKTYKGEDGKVRVADIKTASGQSTRPIHRLAPLLPEETVSVCSTSMPSHQRPIDDIDIIPSKKLKQLNSQLFLTMIITLLLIPVVLAGNIKISKFRTDPGLYFEGLGTTKLVTAEWRLMVYYNLEPLSSEIEGFQTGLNTLQQLCFAIQQQSPCNALVKNLAQIRDELIQEKELFATSRSKRGAFNVVGNIARSLFGVLDSDYAEEMSNTINLAKAEKNNMLLLLKNQTSIIDSTLNVIRQDETNTQNKINEIIGMINEEANAIHKASTQVNQMQLIGLLASQLTLMAANLQKTEAEIIDVLTDAHHGKISPSLLSPHQLKAELTTIKAHLPAYRTLPLDDGDLLQFYKLMNAKGAVIKKEVIFEIKLPLVDQQSLELFKIIPVPIVTNKTITTINSCSSHLAVNSHRDQFIPLNIEDVNNCIKPKPDIYICKNKQSKFGRDSDMNSCEISIFTNRTTTGCKLDQVSGNSVWIQLQNQNKWMFAIIEAIEMSAVCGTDSHQFMLRGSGIMEIEQNCVIKNNVITIEGHFEALNALHTSYANFRKINSISTPHELNRLHNNTIHQLKAQLDRINNIQQQLHESTFVHIPETISANTQHHHAVSYTALILSAILLFVIILYKLRSTRQNDIKEEGQAPPNPMSIDIIDT